MVLHRLAAVVQEGDWLVLEAAAALAAPTFTYCISAAEGADI
jgi:hypothetical protein